MDLKPCRTRTAHDENQWVKMRAKFVIFRAPIAQKQPLFAQKGSAPKNRWRNEHAAIARTQCARQCAQQGYIGFATQRIHSQEYSHGNFHNSHSRHAAAAGRTCSGFRAAGFDRNVASPVRSLRLRSCGPAFLPRALVTFLPPPVGGLSRTRCGNSRGGRRPCGHFSGRSGKIAGCA